MHPYRYADLIGVPFVRGGRDPKTGLDCYGVVLEMHRRAGVTIPDFVSPSEIEHIADLIDAARNSGEWKRVDKRTPGACLVFRIEGVGGHVGYMLDRENFIHTDEALGVCVDRVSMLPWRDSLLQAYTYE